MTFPRTIKDRVVQYPGRYQLVNVSGTTYDLVPVPGTITEAGTQINKAFLQPIEDALAAGMSYKSQLPSNANFNTQTSPGIYGVGSTASMSNTPLGSASSSWAVLEVLSTGGFIVQRFYLIVNGGLNSYYRTRMDTGAVWSAWKKIANEDDINNVSLKTTSRDARGEGAKTPQWYITNGYANRAVLELNTLNNVGGIGGGMCHVQTLIPWHDVSGCITQIVIDTSGKTYTRYSVDGTTWSTLNKIVFEADMELVSDIPNTTQVPIIVNGVITKIQHKSNANLAVLREDVFSYSTNLITYDKLQKIDPLNYTPFAGYVGFNAPAYNQTLELKRITGAGRVDLALCKSTTMREGYFQIKIDGVIVCKTAIDTRAVGMYKNNEIIGAGYNIIVPANGVIEASATCQFFYGDLATTLTETKCLIVSEGLHFKESFVLEYISGASQYNYWCTAYFRGVVKTS